MCVFFSNTAFKYSRGVKVDKEVPVEEEAKPAEDKPEEEKKEDDDETQPEVKEVEEEEAKKPKTKTVKEKVSEWERVNKNKAIWLRDAKEITKEEYVALSQYHHLSASCALTDAPLLLPGTTPSISHCQRTPPTPLPTSTSARKVR